MHSHPNTGSRQCPVAEHKVTGLPSIKSQAQSDIALLGSLLVGVWPTLGSTLHDADEAAVVDKTLLRTASERLLLLLLGHLGRLILHLTSTRQTAVHLTHAVYVARLSGPPSPVPDRVFG